VSDSPMTPDEPDDPGAKGCRSGPADVVGPFKDMERYIVPAPFPLPGWFRPRFRDAGLEDMYFWEKHACTMPRLHRVRNIHAGMTALWLFLPSDLPLPVWLFFRINNIISFVACAFGVRQMAEGDAKTWAKFDAASFAWGAHHLGYNSLTASQVARFLGVVSIEEHDECYQLMFCLLGLIGFHAFARMDLLRLLLLMHLGLSTWIFAAVYLGTSLQVSVAFKMGFVYYATTLLCFLDARSADLEGRNQFVLARELEEDTQQQGALVEGFRRMLATNYDALTTLEVSRNMMIFPDKCDEVSSFCGHQLANLPLLLCGADLQDRSRLNEFANKLWAQVRANPSSFMQSPPLTVDFSLPQDAGNSCKPSAKAVELQAIWVPGAHPQKMVQVDQPDETRLLGGLLWLGVRAAPSTPAIDNVNSNPKRSWDSYTPKQFSATSSSFTDADAKSGCGSISGVYDEILPKDSASQLETSLPDLQACMTKSCRKRL